MCFFLIEPEFFRFCQSDIGKIDFSTLPGVIPGYCLYCLLPFPGSGALSVRFSFFIAIAILYIVLYLLFLSYPS